MDTLALVTPPQARGFVREQSVAITEDAVRRLESRARSSNPAERQTSVSSVRVAAQRDAELRRAASSSSTREPSIQESRWAKEIEAANRGQSNSQTRNPSVKKEIDDEQDHFGEEDLQECQDSGNTPDGEDPNNGNNKENVKERGKPDRSPNVGRKGGLPSKPQSIIRGSTMDSDEDRTTVTQKTINMFCTVMRFLIYLYKY